MHRGAVLSNVVKLGLNPELRVLLDDYIKDSLTIPIILFKTTTTEDAILLAVEYLKEKMEGVVEIPATDTEPWVKIVASRTSLGDPRINFITTKHRYPTVENRPYTDEPWEVGDIVLNNDISDTKCLGWGCMVGGSPGTWEQFGHFKRWYSQLEQVDSLPDPSELQANRQVIYVDPESVEPDVYYCAMVPSTGEWTWVKMTIFADDVAAVVQDYFDKNPIGVNVEAYLVENPLTSSIEVVLEAANWTGTSAPYSMTLTNSEFLNAIDGIMSLSQSCTSEQILSATNARICITSQDGDTITLSAYGIKPTVDIPVTILIINNRSYEGKDPVYTGVEAYLRANPVTDSIELVLRATNWTGDTAPYQQQLVHVALASADDGIANISSACTTVQLKAAEAARLTIASQEGTKLNVEAYGTKPTVDIPITVLLINDRSN